MSSFRSVYDSSNADERPANYKPTQWRAQISAPSCAVCNKSVYPAEEVTAAGQKFHKLCLKCTSCSTLLNPGNLDEREKKIYCAPCYRRLFAPRAVGRGLATSYIETPPNTPDENQEEPESNTELINTNDQRLSRSPPDDNDFRRSTSLAFSGGVTARQTNPSVNRPTSASVINGAAFKTMSISGNTCPRCSKTVYSAEEIKAAGKSYHKRCYNCANCKASLSGGRYSERNGELYDNNCYQRLFGPRGVGFGMGAGALSTGN